jgi:hypothetical protein
MPGASPNDGFFERVNIDAGTGCWNWLRGKTSAGYGELFFRGKVAYAHRVSAILFKGFDPSSGLQVLHRCDNPGCVNPNHLFYGMDADNRRDCSEKGRIRNQNIGKTHCKEGHLLSGDNLVIRPRSNGSGKPFRACKECAREKCKRYRQRLVS